MKKKNARFPIQKTSATSKRHYTEEQMSLPGVELPPAPPAVWPAGGLEQIALRYLLRGDELRQDKFSETWRLAALIFSLNAKGWPCIKRPIDVKGRNRPITGYRLDMSAPTVQAALHHKGAA